MKTNWIKTLKLDRSKLNNSDVSIILDCFFSGYTYVSMLDNGDFIIRDSNCGKETIVRKIRLGYEYDIKTFEDGKDITKTNYLLYYNYVKPGDGMMKYESALETYKKKIAVNDKTNEKMVTKRRMVYVNDIYDEDLYGINNSYVGYKTTYAPYVKCQSEITYVDLDNKGKYVNVKPDICVVTETTELDNGNYRISNCDIVDGLSAVVGIKTVPKFTSLADSVICFHIERLDDLPPINKKEIKKKKLGFI